jgi:hypothetical protein
MYNTRILERILVGKLEAELMKTQFESRRLKSTVCFLLIHYDWLPQQIRLKFLQFNRKLSKYKHFSDLQEIVLFGQKNDT